MLVNREFWMKSSAEAERGPPTDLPPHHCLACHRQCFFQRSPAQRECGAKLQRDEWGRRRRVLSKWRSSFNPCGHLLARGDQYILWTRHTERRPRKSVYRSMFGKIAISNIRVYRTSRMNYSKKKMEDSSGRTISLDTSEVSFQGKFQ